MPRPIAASTSVQVSRSMKSSKARRQRRPSLPREVGNAVHLSRPEDDFKSGSLGRFRACPTGSVDEVVELSVDGSGAGASPADEGVAGDELVDGPLSELCNCPS